MAEPNRQTTEMSGGQNPKPIDEPNTHGQPSDAVPMADLPQSNPDGPAAQAADPSSSSTKPQVETAANTATTNATSNEPLSSSKATEQVNADAAATAEDPAADSIAAPPPPAKTNTSDSFAIGPSVDHVQSVQPSDHLVCNITLLLTTGARHPYRLDDKYLSKRNVTVPGKTEDGKDDPFTISVYTLKELILREWREEWDPKPASPSSIRLIHFGKLLDDKEPLKQYHFSAESANVVHMTVRPADIVDEEEPKGGGKSSSGGARRSGGGCCVIL